MEASIVLEEIGLDGFRKRSGRVVPFHPRKIESAVRKAAEAASRKSGQEADAHLPRRIAQLVVSYLNDPQSEYYVFPDDEGLRIPDIEDVQDLVEVVLAEANHADIVAVYKRYRKQRDRSRLEIRVRDPLGRKNSADITDAGLLLVESASSDVSLPWDRDRIVEHLMGKTELSAEEAIGVAKAVENAVVASGLRTVSSTLIRELVNNELIERGRREQLRDLSLYGISRDFVEKLMFTKSTENSNVVNNNPEAVNLSLAELVLKQWALDTIFSQEVKRAHDTGAVHLHDLGYPHRVYCSSHSVEYVKKFGLKDLANLNTESSPARSAAVLCGHLNTFLASMQANYAGALGLAYINILFAPYLRGMSAKDIHQTAQLLIFNGSQNAFSRGGQTLFLDFNIHSGVPRYLRTVPAIGPGGHYILQRADGSTLELQDRYRRDEDGEPVRAPSGHFLTEAYYHGDDGQEVVVWREIVETHTNGKTTQVVVDDPVVEAAREARGERLMNYGDYEQEAREFCRALLQVFAEGDRNGRVFEFPKCDFHICDETFTDPAQYEIYQEACELASRNGSTYFIFDRDEVTLSACCRLRTTIDDTWMLRHPESMRFCGFQNVTINIPQAMFRAARGGDATFEGLCREIDWAMDIAVEAHLQKKKMIAEMISGPGRPLYQIGREALDGVPYVTLETCTYIIGLIGVNDAVKYLLDQELHDSPEALALGLRIVAHMYLRVKEYSKKHNLKFTLEESPAESAARRLAKTDLVYFGDEAEQVVKGDDDAWYYTNSIHLAADAPVSLVERIRKQSMFHSLIESGAITHAFVGEEQPHAEAIASLMARVHKETQSAQVTISPEFTYCSDCDRTTRGLKEACAYCGSTDVVGETRVVGYFSKIHNWNKSKRLGELPARQRGSYSINAGDAMQQLCTAADAESDPVAAEV